jgi:hypothetical protein
MLDSCFFHLSREYSYKSENCLKLIKCKEYFQFLNLKDNGFFTTDQISIIKNLSFGRSWAKNGYFTLEDYENPACFNVPHTGLLLDRKSFLENLVLYQLDGKVSAKYTQSMLDYFDIYFKNSKVFVNSLHLDVLYSLAIIESEEYLMNVIRFSPEIFICISAINILIDLGFSNFEILEVLNSMLSNDDVWVYRMLYKKSLNNIKIYNAQIGLAKSYDENTGFNSAKLFYESVLSDFLNINEKVDSK